MSVQLKQNLQLSYYDAMATDLLAEQNKILLARMYYHGNQPVALTDRQLEFLAINPDNPFSMNVCRIVVSTLTDELVLMGFATNETDGKKPVSEFISLVSSKNKLDIVQSDLYNISVRDSEAFVLLDWNDSEKYPKFVIHEAYTSTDASAWEGVGYGVTDTLMEKGTGTGNGVYIKYKNDDRGQEVEFAVQYWYKNDLDNDGNMTSTHRRTIYYDDRIEREAYIDGHWVEFEEPQAWKNKQGQAIGIPVVSFPNKDLRCEFWDVMTTQDIINKTIADTQASLDFYGFRIMFIKGAFPTTDGKPPDSTGSNVFYFQPGQSNGWGDKPANEIDVQVIEAEDPTPMMNAIKDYVMFVAQFTGTPSTKFTATAQVASAETLKEQKDSLNKRADKLKSIYSDAWKQVMRLAIRINNAFNTEQYDEAVEITPIWKSIKSTEDLERETSLGISPSVIWSKLGYSQEQIATMKAEPSFRIQFAKAFWEAYVPASAYMDVDTFAKFVGMSEDDMKLLIVKKEDATETP